MRFSALLPLCALAVQLPSAPPVDPPPIDDSFSETIPTGWHHPKGRWQIADGALQGTEIAGENHAAVIRRPLAFTDARIAFSFRLDRARRISLSINDAKEHVCRLIVDAQGFTAQKDDHDHQGPDKATIFARISRPLSTDEWHSATVEIRGAALIAVIDGDEAHAAKGSHALLDRPKANFGFTVTQGPAEFRNVVLQKLAPPAKKD